jgi:outer membrane receptor for ferrienterochelin and colicin
MVRLFLRCLFSVTALLVPLELRAQQQLATLRGTVSTASGDPAVDTAVSLLDRVGSRVATTRSQADGRFLLEGVPPGTFTLHAEGPAQMSVARPITIEGALTIEVMLTLAPHLAESVVVEGLPEAPAVATRVTVAGETLRRIPVRHSHRALQQVLSTLPGWAGEDNGLLHIRGVDDGLLYVQDGVPVYDRLDAVFGIAADPTGIGSLSVLTGFIPPEYGLKAGAVIEVQSPLRRSSWIGDLDAGLGSNELSGVRGAAGGPLGGNGDLGLSFASERSDRFLDPVHPENFHNTGRAGSVEAHVTLLPSRRDLVRVSAALGGSRYDVPHNDMQEAGGQDQRQHLRQNAQSGSWQRFWSETLVSQVAGYRRSIDATLEGSERDTPVTAASDRLQERLGVRAALTYHRGAHTMKAGFEAASLQLHEDFSFAVTDPEAAEEAEISDAAAQYTLADPFRFRDQVQRTQSAFFVQDSVRAGDRLTIDFGVRFDRTNLLVPASQWSPRLGAVYAWPGTATTVRGSVNRFFQPPQPEHLLLSSSAEARELSPFERVEPCCSGIREEDEGADQDGGADLFPERQTAWEVGVEHWLAGMVRLDAAYWSRHVKNYADPNVFFGTTIIFPNSVASGLARGLDLRLEVPRYRGWSLYANYTLSEVEQVGPINGGLFLEDEVLEIGPGTRFTPDHDQRHVGGAGATYHNVTHGSWLSLAVRHESGTPLEVNEDEIGELMERAGSELVNVERLRVKPRTVFDVAVAQRIGRWARTELSARLSVLNLTGQAYAFNFGNPFSGTHFGAGRGLRVDVTVGIR